MLTNRMIDAYNRSRASTRYPKINIVISEDQWQLPVGVYKDELMDGWYDASGNQVNPSDFWTVKELDVALGGDVPLALTTEYDGIVLVQTLNYFVLWDKGMYKEIKDSYAFLVNDVQYRLSNFTLLPSMTDPALMQITLRLWDETYMVK
jgi:hypothetical protein